MTDVVRFEHHGRMVKAFADTKGLHTKHCMCYRGCEKFKPGGPDNCRKAQRLYELCVDLGMVTPVYECPDYRRKMTLDDAIEHAYEVAATAECEDCRDEHLQLAGWLEELRTLKYR